MAITKSWLEGGRTDWQSVLQPRTTLITENDGAVLRGRANGSWHRLAVYQVAASPHKYLVCIQSFLHPAKEPCQAARVFGSAVLAAAFLIAYDPPALSPANRRPTGTVTASARRDYDHQLDAVLRDLDRALGIFVR